jgi:uncharacterized protein (DUF427 family)
MPARSEQAQQPTVTQLGHAGSCPRCGTDLEFHTVIVDGTVRVCDRCVHEVPPAPDALRTDCKAVFLVQAVWGGVVLADSRDSVHLAGVAYFPPGQVRMEHLEASRRVRINFSCGEAHLLNILVGGRRCADAAWHWPPPSPLARHLPGWIGFGPQVMLTTRPLRSP